MKQRTSFIAINQSNNAKHPFIGDRNRGGGVPDTYLKALLVLEILCHYLPTKPLGLFIFGHIQVPVNGNQVYTYFSFCFRMLHRIEAQ